MVIVTELRRRFDHSFITNGRIITIDKAHHAPFAPKKVVTPLIEPQPVVTGKDFQRYVRGRHRHLIEEFVILSALVREHGCMVHLDPVRLSSVAIFLGVRSSSGVTALTAEAFKASDVDRKPVDAL